MARPQLSAVLLGDTSHNNHHGCQMVMHHLRAGLAEAGIRISLSLLARNWQSHAPARDAIAAADLLVVHGEGAVHHDCAGGMRRIEAAEFAASQGTPSYLVNATWHSNSPAVTRRAAVFRAVFVRESISAGELEEGGIASTVVPDLTFGCGPRWSSRPRAGFLVTDSAVQAANAQLWRAVQSSDQLQFAPLVSSQWLAGTKISRVTRWRRSLQRAIGAFLGPLGCAPVRYRALAHALATSDQYLDLLSSSEAVLTGRFHGACFAMITGTPMLALPAASQKIEALLRDAGLTRARTLQSGFDADGVHEQLRTARFTADEEARLHAYVSSAPRKIADMFEFIANDVSNRSANPARRAA